MSPTSSTTKAITKREACNILNISYNTTRLDKILEDHNNQKEYRARRVSKNRGRPARPDEIKDIIEEYLSGENVSNISKRIYRSASFVKSILERIGVPQRPVSSEDRRTPMYLPEECVANDFEEGEIVWSATHHAPAEIQKKQTKELQKAHTGLVEVDYEEKYGCDCYSIYVRQKPSGDLEDFFNATGIGGYYSYSLASDLGKLKHLQEYGIKLENL